MRPPQLQSPPRGGTPQIVGLSPSAKKDTLWIRWVTTRCSRGSLVFSVSVSAQLRLVINRKRAWLRLRVQFSRGSSSNPQRILILFCFSASVSSEAHARVSCESVFFVNLYVVGYCCGHIRTWWLKKAVTGLVLWKLLS